MNSVDETTCLPQLLMALQHNESKRVALVWLYRHAKDAAYRRQLWDTGAEAFLVHTIETSQDDYACQLYAIGCLATLEVVDQDILDDKPLYLHNCRSLVRVPTSSECTRWYQAIDLHRPESEWREASELVSCLSEARPETSYILPFLPRMVFFLRRRYARITVAAAHAMSHVGKRYAERMVAHGAIPLLIELVEW